MESRNNSSVDPWRIAQAILKFVLIPAAILGGCVVTALDVRRDPNELATVLRLVMAASLGGLVGIERQLSGHWAGLRTHMMVALGATVFAILGAKTGPGGDATRVIQGIAAGIGFLGAGTILKLSDRLEVIGLTTASSIWLAAAVGAAVGLGLYTLSVAATVMSLGVLALLHPLERRFLDQPGERRQ